MQAVAAGYTVRQFRLYQLLGRDEGGACVFTCKGCTEVTRLVGEVDLTRFNKIATQGAPQMAVDKEANSLSRVYSCYSKFNLCLFYM